MTMTIKSSCPSSPSAANYDMAGTGNKMTSLRPNRFEGERIMLALAISLFIHVLFFGGYELNKEIRLLLHLPSLRVTSQKPILVQQYADPIEFVTVPNPSDEAPEKPKYISSKNSVAADNSVNKDTDNPELNGKQSDVPQTIDESRFQQSKSPVGADQHQADASQESQPQPKPSSSAGDMTLGKPDNTTQQQEPRPRTLKEAYAEMAKHLPSMTMNESGGVRHHARTASFDVKVTGFGDYDERFAEAVDMNWNNLLDSQRFSLDRTGKVVLLFQLNSDGHISQMQVVQSTVGPLLAYVCEKAVLEGAPYEPWTQDMRLKLGESIPVQYTFDYEYE